MKKFLRKKVENGVPYLEYPLLADTGLVRHGFSTRLGGVSEGVCQYDEFKTFQVGG